MFYEKKLAAVRGLLAVFFTPHIELKEKTKSSAPPPEDDPLLASID
jgi:hypothetical protein